MFDMFGMMDKLKKLKSATEEAKKRLDAMTLEATSINGWVKILITGNKQVKDITLSEDFLKQDAAVISEHLVKTMNEALQNADMANKTEIKNATAGLIPNIPGVDLSSLGM